MKRIINKEVKKNKILILIIFMLLLIPIVFAAVETLGTFKEGEEVDLLQSGANFTFCNITSVRYPINNSVLLENVQMTKDNNEYNYTLNTSSTKAIGRYIVTGFCSNSTSDIVWAYDFEITPTGTILKTSDSLTYILLTIGSFIFFALSLWGGIVLPFKNKRNDEEKVESIQKLKYFKLLCFATSYILFVWLLNLFLTLSTNFLILTQYTKFFEVIFSVVNSFSYPFFVVMFIIMLFLAWKDLALRKLLLRGINPS